MSAHEHATTCDYLVKHGTCTCRPTESEAITPSQQVEAALKVIDQAVADLIYHVRMESDSPDYRTEHGWRDVADLLADISRALGVEP